MLFLSMLLGSLGAILSRNVLAGTGIVRTSYGNKKSTRNCKSRLWIKKKILILLHPLTNFEIQKYYQNEATVKGATKL